ncbi:MAG: hypothetical protein WC262_09410, partial [Bacteroidales bacterium]
SQMKSAYSLALSSIIPTHSLLINDNKPYPHSTTGANPSIQGEHIATRFAFIFFHPFTLLFKLH